MLARNGSGSDRDRFDVLPEPVHAGALGLAVTEPVCTCLAELPG